MSLLSQLTPNALTQHDMKIETNEDGMPNTFVPARNLLFYHLRVPLLPTQRQTYYHWCM